MTSPTLPSSQHPIDSTDHQSLTPVLFLRHYGDVPPYRTLHRDRSSIAAVAEPTYMNVLPTRLGKYLSGESWAPTTTTKSVVSK